MSRSDSVNRTVVDLSLSFFIPVSFYNPINCVSLPRSKEERQLIGIASVSPVEEFSLIFTATNGDDEEIFIVPRERPSPA
jgi:hypothetical protein